MLLLTQLLIALLFTLLITLYLKLQWLRRRYPPGPTPLPIIGNLWTLKFVLHHETLMQLAKTYGNVFTVWLGRQPVVVLNGYQTIREGLISHSEAFVGRPTTPSTEELAKGKGIAFSSGHKWKQLRRFALTVMRNLGLGKKSLEARVQQEAQTLVEFFAMQRGKSLDPTRAITLSVSNVISSMIFGHCFSRDDKEFHQLIEANENINNNLNTIWAQLFDTFPWLMRHLPGPHNNIFKGNAFVEEFVKKEIKSHKENGVSEEPQDLIDFYQTKISENYQGVTSTFDEQDMIRLVAELFGGGTETTTTTLRWAILYLVNRPEIQEKIQKELSAVFGESQIIHYEDRKRVPYTNAVIHEILRKSNVASIGMLRQTVKDTSLQGFNIKKGSVIIANVYSSLYDPDYWETPKQFNPGHFLDMEGNFIQKEAFIPFSAGHRMCVGEPLARIELFIFFTSLLRAFSFRLPKGVKNVNMDIVLGATVQPHPFQICAIPR